MQPLRSVVLALPLVAAFAVAAVAQVPPHSVVVGTISFAPTNTGLPFHQPGTTGLFIAPLPTTANPGMQVVTPITGLPAQLTVPDTQIGGAFSVLRLPDDRLVVGGIGRTPELYLLTLNGTAVVTTQTLPIGTAIPGWAIPVGTARFPDGRVLVTMANRTLAVPGSGPAAVSELAILDPSAASPTLTPVPIRAGAFSSYTDSAQVSADGRTAFVLTQPGSFRPQYQLHAVDVDSGSATYGAVTLLHTFAATEGWLSRPELRDDGILVITSEDTGFTQTTVHLVDTKLSPVFVASLPMNTAYRFVHGPATDPATGASVFPSLGVTGVPVGPFTNALVLGPTYLGPLTPFAALPNWCLPWTVDIHSSFERYGTGTAAADEYTIVDSPNPGGLPEVGTTSFSVSVRSTGSAPNLAWLVLGVQPQSVTVIGLDLLVVPLVAVGMSGGAQPRLTLPIPGDLSLAGASIFAQALLSDRAGYASSDAVKITIVH